MWLETEKGETTRRKDGRSRRKRGRKIKFIVAKKGRLCVGGAVDEGGSGRASRLDTHNSRIHRYVCGCVKMAILTFGIQVLLARRMNCIRSRAVICRGSIFCNLRLKDRKRDDNGGNGATTD